MAGLAYLDAVKKETIKKQKNTEKLRAHWSDFSPITFYVGRHYSLLRFGRR